MPEEDRIRGRGEAPVSVVAGNGGQEAAECNVKIDFAGGKGEALEIQKVWRGQGRQLISGVGVQCKERWESVCWDRYR